MVTAWRMNDWEGIRSIFSRKFKSAISQFLLTMIATVVFDLTVAIHGDGQATVKNLQIPPSGIRRGGLRHRFPLLRRRG